MWRRSKWRSFRRPQIFLIFIRFLGLPFALVSTVKGLMLLPAFAYDPLSREIPTQIVRVHADVLNTADKDPQKSAEERIVFRYRKEERPREVRVEFLNLSPETVAVSEICTADAWGELQSMWSEQNQLGESGRIDVSNDRVYFDYKYPNGKSEKDDEALKHPLVAPCTLPRFLNAHWEELRAGKTVQARLALIERQETVGIEIEKATPFACETEPCTFKLSPSSVILNLLAPSIEFQMDPNTHELISFTGPVPVQLRQGEKWEKFKAFVKTLP